MSGNWGITVVASGESTTTRFLVPVNGVSPFTVSIDLPPYLTWSASEMVATVKAKYPNGGPVKGTVNVVVKLANPPIGTEKSKRMGRGILIRDTIDGLADFHFNLFKDLR